MIATGVSNATLVQVALGLVGGGGIVTAFVSYRMLGPNRNTAAVTQSQTAMEMTAQLLTAMEKDRDDWRDRAERAEAALDKAERRLAALEAATRRSGRRGAREDGA